MNSGDRPEPQPLRGLRAGLFFWGAFAVVAVLIRGVRWDENYEFAQVLNGTLAYPAHHPLPLHLARLHTLQLDGLSLLMHIFPGACWPNVLRNVLVLMAATLPTFWLGARLSASALAGHAVALLFLFGMHAGFHSNYPVQIWPGLYSNGTIGTGWAMLSAGLLAMGRTRSGHVAAALQPFVHAGQWPPVLLFQAGMLVRAYRRGDRSDLRWGAVSLSCAAVGMALWWGVRPILFPALPQPLPALPSAEAAVWMRAALQGLDGHRQPLPEMGWLGLALCMALAIGLMRHPNTRPACRLLAAYVLLLCGIVLAVGAAHSLMGANTPGLLLGWMPYRLLNQAVALALLLGFGMLARSRPAVALALPPLLLAGQCASALAPALGARYFADGHYLAFLIFGSALCVAWRGALPAFVVTLGMAIFHQFGAACMAVGIIAAQRNGRRAPIKRSALCIAVAVLLALVVSARDRAPLRTDDETRFRNYLREHGTRQDLALASPMQEGMQARLDIGMAADMATLTWLPYQPALGPHLARLYAEAFGRDLTQGHSVNWVAHWQSLHTEDWERLHRTWRIRWVIAPPESLPLLQPAVKGEDFWLYRTRWVAGEQAANPP